MHILHNTLSRFKPVSIYNLDVIISVGYRVKSKRGTQFRQWANKVIKEFLMKGYAINQLTDTMLSIHEKMNAATKLTFSYKRHYLQRKASFWTDRFMMPMPLWQDW